MSNYLPKKNEKQSQSSIGAKIEAKVRADVDAAVRQIQADALRSTILFGCIGFLTAATAAAILLWRA